MHLLWTKFWDTENTRSWVACVQINMVLRFAYIYKMNKTAAFVTWQVQ